MFSTILPWKTNVSICHMNTGLVRKVVDSKIFDGSISKCALCTDSNRPEFGRSRSTTFANVIYLLILTDPSVEGQGQTSLQMCFIHVLILTDLSVEGQGQPTLQMCFMY